VGDVEGEKGGNAHLKNSSSNAALRELAFHWARTMSPTTGTKPTPAEIKLFRSILY
jgi:hypothetical protein